ncbi:PREDICTED: putative F-box/LRR-repeat protein At5g15620 [Camelina sativa]|uniref:F-box/LRR-repeat protein At5g15620 n=1 Tax=Camelina sativa TaxID=90675 RepID=A0ABM0ZCA8_CAMSA|nr:PREDICTED: putative F-box/LRR-repeat protein At5g15620 [Camelina sativa]
MDLSSLGTVEIFFCFYRGAIPVFENLSRLSIATEVGSCWKLVPLLLKISPNLETLVIKGPLHNDLNRQGIGPVCECLCGSNFLLSCPVKVLELTKFRGTKGELEQMKHLLEKLPCLELVKVLAWATNEEAKLQLAMDLLTLLRPCKIQLKFFSG